MNVQLGAKLREGIWAKTEMCINVFLMTTPLTRLSPILLAAGDLRESAQRA